MEPQTQATPPTANELVAINETATEVAKRAAQIDAAPTLAEKADALWAMTQDMRHATLGQLPPTTVAALIETDPDRNLRLLGNLPAMKFQQILNLGTFAQGRTWLERAVTSGSLAAAILPSLMTSRDLSEMLLTDPDFRRALPRLLNYERAQRWRQLLTTNEWHANIDELLMSDTDELLRKANIKNKNVHAILQSLIDFVPELYLETVNYAAGRLKNAQDRPDEFEDITSTPFGMPEILQTQPDAASGLEVQPQSGAETVDSPLADLIPESGDPVFALATAGLTSARKAVLEDQLKHLLRQEIVATASFAQGAMARAAGRVLFYLRAGLESFGPSVEDATRALETRNLNEISAIGARLAESYRQKSLALAGHREWLDGRQRQFLDAMKQPEAGMHPETKEPVLWLAGKPKQDRAEWHPTPLSEIATHLSEIGAWASLARAAFGTPERTHAIFTQAKARTAGEALRRTVIALALYRRWEPELVRPNEDVAAFYRQFGKGRRNNFDAVRQTVLDALDQTPSDAWKPSDAKARARELLLRAVTELENAPPPAPPKKPAH
ncbi:hypothetical protein CCAX7_001730 [Capsulimonas corticalis]|uniref:Uncharacterized protein n=1 Tax=Capsulimonas corticalis TaxID=2219043 RepID=A0A402CRW4_9BACT|nr:hypothetical protein [Capsulimonas corticalis]BDI28122.1 hypothetical protein CCAX7_001730 [Capsulimonas corticalis]